MAGRRGGEPGGREVIERAAGRRLIVREDLERVRLEEAARVRRELPSVRVVRPADLLALTFGFRNDPVRRPLRADRRLWRVAAAGVSQVSHS